MTATPPTPRPPGLESVRGRRLLLLNWRDLDHPQAGGAEVYTERVAAEWAQAGADVTLVTSGPPGLPLATLRDGVRIIRTGSRFGVYGRALMHLARHRDEYDVVVDFQNGVPFFAPLVAGRKLGVVLVLHHVHQRQFDQYFPFPLNVVGRLLEGPISRWVYGRSPVVVVSPSTRAGVRLELKYEGPVHIIPNGASVPLGRPTERSHSPRIALVTRLVPHKRLDLLLDAVAALRTRHPGLHLDLGGDGEAGESLRLRAAELGIEDAVSFHGRVSEERRTELLSSAWLTVVPSVAEGWGLTVIETNGLGRPAVATRVPGLCDSVLDDGRTGWLVDEPDQLVEGIDQALRALASEEQASAMAERCRRWARQFSWERTADRLANVVLSEIAHPDHETSRRSHNDLCTLVSFDAEPGEEEGLRDRIVAALRRTDLVVTDHGRVQVLMHGLDEVTAVGRLDDLGLPQPDDVRLASQEEILTGRVSAYTVADEHSTDQVDAA